MTHILRRTNRLSSSREDTGL